MSLAFSSILNGHVRFFEGLNGPPEGGGDGLPMEEDTRMDDDKSSGEEIGESTGGYRPHGGDKEGCIHGRRHRGEDVEAPGEAEGEVDDARGGIDDIRAVGTAHMVGRCAKQPAPGAGHCCGGGRQVGHSKRGRLRRTLAF